MKNTKYHIYLNSEGRCLLISSLNDLRNKLIDEGRYTDLVDEVLIKGNTAQRTPYGLAPHMLAPFPSFCTKLA